MTVQPNITGSAREQLAAMLRVLRELKKEQQQLIAQLPALIAQVNERADLDGGAVQNEN